jgi:hypothetical protein
MQLLSFCADQSSLKQIDFPAAVHLTRSPRCIERKRILLAEFNNNFRVTPGRSSITANYLEVGFAEIGVGQGRYVIGFHRLRDGFLN